MFSFIFFVLSLLGAAFVGMCVYVLFGFQKAKEFRKEYKLLGITFVVSSVSKKNLMIELKKS